MSHRRKLPPPEEVVAAIVALADDGFCRRGELAQRFPKSAHATCTAPCGERSRRGW